MFESSAGTLVNPINCVGAMGRGLALEFKKRYPEMFREYRILCARKPLRPGRLWFYAAADRGILNFPIKNH